MESDISKALAYQVKKEIAERYFGSKKLIEDDVSNLRHLIDELNKRYEERLGPAFVRIYSLLMEEDIIDRFIALIGWEEKPFYDSYVNESVTIRKRLLEKMRSHGWIKKSRFVNMVFDAYRMLYREYEQVDELKSEILDELSIIKEELKLFEGKYSIDEIMSFVRQLDINRQSMSNVMGSNIDVLDTDKIAQTVKLEDISNLEAEMPYLHSLPEPAKVEDEIEKLAAMAYSRHPEIAVSAVGMAKR